MEQEDLRFIELLNSMTKLELVNYISNYWQGLKTEALDKMNSGENYMIEEFGRVLMTQSIKMKNILEIKSPMGNNLNIENI